MPALSKHAPKLLGIVNGKRHATDDDHEEPIAKRRMSPAARKTQEDEDIYAEPVWTDDELPVPPAPTSKSAGVVTASPNADEDLPVPATNPVKAASAMKTRQDIGKENAVQGTQSSAGDNPYGFGMEHASQSKSSQPKKTFGSKAKTSNIHARPAAKKPVKFGKPTAIRVPNSNRQASKVWKKGKQTQGSDDGLSDCSMLDDDGLAEILGPAPKHDPELRKVGKKGEKPQGSDNELSDCSMLDENALAEILGPPRKHDPELRKVEVKKRPSKEHGDANSSRLTNDQLDEWLKSTPDDGDIRRTLRRPKTTVLHNQLDNWRKDRAPESTQPTSSAPQEDGDDIHEYIDQLPGEDVEGSCCPLCRAPLQHEDYWEFRKDKDKTVKNQNAFCRHHKVKSAWDEYRSEGYPDIDWDVLPQRIRKHRMELFKILYNERPSVYRDRYEPVALTGKAAAVPSRRKDLPDHVQQELDSYAMDDQLTYPGYYGPHGRRIITETVMRILKNEIKNCLDTVVQGSGPATFVQAVLVPETAIMLIMEDCLVDREEAEETREKTYELGMLLNEEIEDHLEAHEQSDDENEYGGK